MPRTLHPRFYFFEPPGNCRAWRCFVLLLLSYFFAGTNAYNGRAVKSYNEVIARAADAVKARNFHYITKYEFCQVKARQHFQQIFFPKPHFFGYFSQFPTAFCRRGRACNQIVTVLLPFRHQIVIFRGFLSLFCYFLPKIDTFL